MIDAPRLIWEYLQADTALTALVSTRIYYGQFPNTGGANFTNANMAILFNFTGGQAARHYEVYTPVVQFRCYGGSTDYAGDKSFQVYRALHDALQLGSVMQSKTSGVFMGAAEIGIGQTLIEPETEWPVTIAQFECKLKALPS